MTRSARCQTTSAYIAAHTQATTSMSGRMNWLCEKKPYVVASARPPITPGPRPSSRSPARNVNTTAAIAASATGSCAVASVTRPTGAEDSAMSQAKSGGFSRKSLARTRTSNGAPRSATSRA